MLFDLWELPVNSFCNKVDMSVKEISDLKNEFPCVFWTMHENQDNIRPVFKPKRNVPFSTLDSVNQELEHLEKSGCNF